MRGLSIYIDLDVSVVLNLKTRSKFIQKMNRMMVNEREPSKVNYRYTNRPNGGLLPDYLSLFVHASRTPR